jgi:hypothetical protein
MGSPFLVDRGGKPKHNISVSVGIVEFGRQATDFPLGSVMEALCISIKSGETAIYSFIKPSLEGA